MSLTPVFPKPPKPFERVMVFIDGGYLRKLCKEHCGHEDIDFNEFRREIVNKFNTRAGNPFQADVIRIYYYDAIVDETQPDYGAQKEYFNSIKDARSCTVRLGRLVESSKKKFKQKGVDILMAIDALTKAYQNQYDTGIFVLGDGDFVPLIEAVKNVGKKTFHVAYVPSCAVELMRCFDMGIMISGKDITKWMKKQSS